LDESAGGRLAKTAGLIPVAGRRAAAPFKKLRRFIISTSKYRGNLSAGEFVAPSVPTLTSGRQWNSEPDAKLPLLVEFGEEKPPTGISGDEDRTN
jgi:hypothetical protein